MSQAILTGVIATVGSVLVAALTIVFGRRQNNADASEKEANAEQIRVGTAVSAATAIRELSAQNTTLQREQIAQARAYDEQQEELEDVREQLTEVLETNERHEEWDLMMVFTVRLLIDAVTAAGIDVPGVGLLPDPPPLAKRTGDSTRS